MDMDVGVGPAVKLVPIRHFQRLTRSDMTVAWQIVGPSAALNLRRYPLWMTIAAAYAEGVEHGMMAAQQQGGRADG